MNPGSLARKAAINEKDLLKGFIRFLEVDLQLSKRTKDRHVHEIKDLLEAGFGVEASREELRRYLATYKEENPNSYANRIKALRRFYRDYLGRGEVVSTYKLPRPVLKILQVPTRKDLHRFYRTIETDAGRIYFLLYAVSGLRRKEALDLEPQNIDNTLRMIVPSKRQYGTKNPGLTFYNQEVEDLLRDFKPLGTRYRRWIPIKYTTYSKIWTEGFEETGIRITPQILRDWFCVAMGETGVPDRYVDAFCGRLPRSVLARHYTDYSPKRLKRIYDKAGLKVLS